MLNDTQTLYDLLDLDPDASPQEIRDAYLKTKTTYNRDNLVLYTLVSPEEREEALKKIEEAYQVLSDPDKRRAYDQNYLRYQTSENPFEGKSASESSEGDLAKIVSIDRVPPMENVFDGENLLIPPKTDFQFKQQSNSQANTQQEDGSMNSGLNLGQQGSTSPGDFLSGSGVETQDLPFLRPEEPSQSADYGGASNEKKEKPATHSVESKSLPKLNLNLLSEVEKEVDFSGGFLRRIREAYQISLEEMSGITKVTKTYLTAIEEENFAKLPAAVFVRGFVVQIAKVLRLPHDKAAAAFLVRYQAKKSEAAK